MPLKVFSPTKENISKAACLLKSGKLVTFPTETVYGLGADATSENAIKLLYEAKGRPKENPLIIHIDSVERLESVADLSKLDSRKISSLEKLFSLWPGPLTIVLPKSEYITGLATAGGDTVAVRIPNHPVALELLREAKLPLAGPSANTSGYVSPTTAQHVAAWRDSRIEMILDGGECSVGVESTVLSLVHQVPTILRPGFITAEYLSKFLNTEIFVSGAASWKSAILSPGTSFTHYSPLTPVALLPLPPDFKLPEKTGYLAFSNASSYFSPTRRLNLSESGDLEEVAHNLYAGLRELDTAGLDLILIDTCSSEGFGASIMDRIRRAAGTENGK